MSTEKLPEWPTANWGSYETQYNMARAALARMEALVEYAREVTCENVHHKPRDYHDAGKPCPVMIRLHKLLAACERKEAGK